jgi:hypothetical protein
MPFTPYHFGPHSCLALPLGKYLDVPAFVLANVIVDLEPLLVMSFRLDYPHHGYLHTFLIGSIAGLAWGLFAYGLKDIIKLFMQYIRIPYQPTLFKTLTSAVLGIWLHVAFDGMIYTDIKSFFPILANPLHGLMTSASLYQLCALAFIPAALLYILTALVYTRNRKKMVGKN